MLSVTVADHNRGEMLFDSLELMKWPVVHETLWQDILCTHYGVFYLEIY